VKAITLWAPHVVLIPFRWKEVETRDWYTGYRGPLAIHVAKVFKPEHAAECARIQQITEQIVLATPEMHAWQAWVRPMLGCVVCTCNLVACLPTAFAAESANKLKPPFVPAHGWDVERLMGKYAPGRWAWILRDVVTLAKPVPARGARKLWDWDQSKGEK
jgi:activating signal cointegrator 1